jgi:spore coat polysaccharide biosynthesis predicted glycosyltransferase SpsG
MDRRDRERADGLSRLLIRTVASPAIGFGHLSRCASLAEQSGLDADACLLFVRGDESTLSKARAIYPGLRFCGCMNEVGRFCRQGDVAAIHDGFSQDHDFFDRVRGRTVALDYSGEEPPRADAVINLFDHSGNARERFGAFGIEYLEGLEFAIIATRFLSFRERHRPRDVPASARRIIVMMGGADPSALTPRIAGFLAGQQVDRLAVDLIVGPLNPHAAALEAVSGSVAPGIAMRIHRQPDNLVELMAGADLAICGCGTTFFEFGFLGVPAVLLAQNPTEARFADYLENEKLTRVATPETLGEVLAHVSGAEERGRLAEAARAAFDGRGAGRILLAGQGRVTSRT